MSRSARKFTCKTCGSILIAHFAGEQRLFDEKCKLIATKKGDGYECMRCKRGKHHTPPRLPTPEKES